MNCDVRCSIDRRVFCNKEYEFLKWKGINVKLSCYIEVTAELLSEHPIYTWGQMCVYVVFTQMQILT